MRKVLRGSLFYFGEHIFLGCNGLTTEEHSHYAVSLIISLSAPFHIKFNSDFPKNSDEKYSAILIPPNAMHTLLADDSDMIVLQFDPKSSEYHHFKDQFNLSAPLRLPIQTFNSVLPSLQSLINGNLTCSSAVQLFYQTLNCLGGSEKKPIILTERMRAVLGEIETILPDNISVSVLAGAIGISEDRFMHWFKENFGIPLRQFLLWKRLHIAAMQLQSGVSLTDASHAAGFADQSHLSKTFKKMFGVAPSQFLGSNEQFKVKFCS
ncbi:MAG: AraC family transcriptional regulator [Leptospira sp.]|nr:AraC family transcriptional regulator [Leptospira sp.]